MARLQVLCMKKSRKFGNGATIYGTSATKAAAQEGRRDCASKPQRVASQQRKSAQALGHDEIDGISDHRSPALLAGKPRGLTATGGVLGQLIPAARKRLAEIDSKIESLTDELQLFNQMRQELQQELDYMVSVQEKIKPALGDPANCEDPLEAE